MDGFTAPDVSMPASADTPSATPDVTASATVQPEATGATPEVAQSQPEKLVAESVPATPELPDEQAFEQLSGPERGNNWKQARARIAELNNQVSQFATNKPVFEQIEQRGGWETVQQYADLGQLLYSQIQDPNTGQISLTAEPLIERLASDSPETLGELVWKGIHQPSPWNDGETIAHTFVREYLGLDPNLLETYRQIQSPADAQKFQQPGQVTADELAGIPEQFHEAYKSLTARQREELALTGDDETKLEFLQDKADALQARQFIAQQNAEREQAKQAQAQQFQERVKTRGTELAQAVTNTALSSAKQKLQTEAKLSSSESHNEALHQESMQWAATECLKDPANAQDNDNAAKLYELSAEAELRGDKIRANQYKVQADSLSKKLEGRFLNMLTKRTAFWSEVLGGSRQAQQQQVEQARPRAEIASSNQSTARQNQSTPNVGQGFQPTAQRMAQYEEMLRASQLQNR